MTKKATDQCLQLFINGQWTKSTSGETRDVINPSNGNVICQVEEAADADVNQAVAAARHSFETGVWRNTTPAQRARILWQIADLIDEEAEQLARLETLDGGKPLTSALHGEVPAAAETFRYYAGWCTKIEGRNFESALGGKGYQCTVRREPVGVAALITPWNGPLVMAAWKLAPALAAGCSVVLKPSEITPLATLHLAKLLQQAGVPDGVVNIVTGGANVGSCLAGHEQVDKLSFTGSIQTARKLLDAAKGNLKKLSLELGGKSPAVIFQDADLEQAIQGVAEGIFGNAGQVCVASSRVYAEKSIYQSVVEGVVAVANTLKLGDPMNSDTQMGPLVSAEHRDNVSAFVDRAISAGANVLAGGKSYDHEGFFYRPTVLVNAAQDSEIVCQEVFGPVVVISPFETEQEAMTMANASEYGLAGSVWTKDIDKAQRCVNTLRTGIVWINCHGVPDLAMPIGGYKQSGWGRELGYEGLEQFLEQKSVLVRVPEA